VNFQSSSLLFTRSMLGVARGSQHGWWVMVRELHQIAPDDNLKQQQPTACQQRDGTGRVKLMACIWSQYRCDAHLRSHKSGLHLLDSQLTLWLQNI